MSTEFLGESRIVLRELARESIGIVGEKKSEQLSDVLKQLDEALDNRSMSGKQTDRAIDRPHA